MSLRAACATYSNTLSQREQEEEEGEKEEMRKREREREGEEGRRPHLPSTGVIDTSLCPSFYSVLAMAPGTHAC